MSNGTYKRTTSASRRAARVIKYKFISKRLVPIKRIGLDGVERMAYAPQEGGQTYRKPV